MGKIPVLEVGGFFLSETVAILEYLDERFPDQPLRSADLEKRARGRQLMNVIQMYVEAPARRLFPGVFMGGRNEPGAEEQVRIVLDVSTAAIARMASPAPFLCGAAPGAADLFAFYNLDIVDRLGRHVWDRSIIAECGLSEWAATMRHRESTKVVLADFDIFFAKYLEDKGAAYHPRIKQEA
jgi:glutathione S-transferase